MAISKEVIKAILITDYSKRDANFWVGYRIPSNGS